MNFKMIKMREDYCALLQKLMKQTNSGSFAETVLFLMEFYMKKTGEMKEEDELYKRGW